MFIRKPAFTPKPDEVLRKKLSELRTTFKSIHKALNNDWYRHQLPLYKANKPTSDLFQSNILEKFNSAIKEADELLKNSKELQQVLTQEDLDSIKAALPIAKDSNQISDEIKLKFFSCYQEQYKNDIAEAVANQKRNLQDAEKHIAEIGKNYKARMKIAKDDRVISGVIVSAVIGLVSVVAYGAYMLMDWAITNMRISYNESEKTTLEDNFPAVKRGCQSKVAGFLMLNDRDRMHQQVFKLFKSAEKLHHAMSKGSPKPSALETTLVEQIKQRKSI